MKLYVQLIVLVLLECSLAQTHNKYTKEANQPEKNENSAPTMRDLSKPFRMQKINMLWEKAKIRLSEPKLRSLYGELKLHDKEEITWKRLKSEGQDKNGLKEAELRRKLLNIMNMYGLLEHFEDAKQLKPKPHKSFNEASEEHINKSLFKDKKLNKLWSKAETAGFSTIELDALREEFTHHQDKIDQYYSILYDVKEGPKDGVENTVDDRLDHFNSLEAKEAETPSKDYIDKANLIRDKHRDINDGFDRLFLLASKGPNSKEFVEPKVQGLWKIALETNFSSSELESLRVELLHYEDRLLKLRHLQAEAALTDQHLKDLKAAGVKSDGMVTMEDNIKKHARKVEKLHLNLETKIMQKHIEL